MMTASRSKMKGEFERIEHLLLANQEHHLTDLAMRMKTSRTPAGSPASLFRAR
jgi:hypothetical protein